MQDTHIVHEKSRLQAASVVYGFPRTYVRHLVRPIPITICVGEYMRDDFHCQITRFIKVPP